MDSKNTIAAIALSSAVIVLWALFFVVAGGAICFIIWAPGKRSESKSSSKKKQFVSGLLYREVTTYVEIEGGKRRDRIRVTQKRFSEE